MLIVRDASLQHTCTQMAVMECGDFVASSSGHIAYPLHESVVLQQPGRPRKYALGHFL